MIWPRLRPSPVPAEGVGVLGEGGVDRDALDRGQQPGQAGHGVRGGSQGDPPFAVRPGGPVGEGVRVEPVADPAGLGGGLPVAQGTDPAGPGGELGVHPGPVRAGQAGGLPGDQGGPPLRGLPGAQRGQGVRQLPDQRAGQAQVPGAPDRAVAPGQPDLRRDAGTDPPLRQPRRPLGGPLGGVQGDRDPRLRGRGGGLQPLQHRQLLDPLHIRDTEPQCVVGAVGASEAVRRGTRSRGTQCVQPAGEHRRSPASDASSTRASGTAGSGSTPASPPPQPSSSIMCSILDGTADRIESRTTSVDDPAETRAASLRGGRQSAAATAIPGRDSPSRGDPSGLDKLDQPGFPSADELDRPSRLDRRGPARPGGGPGRPDGGPGRPGARPGST